jgi:hypothetical protein
MVWLQAGSEVSPFGASGFEPEELCGMPVKARGKLSGLCVIRLNLTVAQTLAMPPSVGCTDDRKDITHK